jgi:DNA-binding CsgD family transcriptional regulator/PAS domain-containing protein
MPQPANVPDLIASLYVAAARNDWAPALQKLGDATGGAFTLLGVVDKATGRTSSFTSQPFLAGSRELYREKFFSINPRSTRAAQAKPGEVFTDSDLADRRSLERHPYYAEFLARSKLGYFAAGKLQNGPERRVNITIQRTTKAGHMPEAGAGLLAQILPHAAAAFDLWERLQAASAQAVLCHAALDAVPYGAMIADASRQIIYANEAGSQALSDDGPLISRERLDVRRRESSPEFQRALDAVLTCDEVRHARTLSVADAKGRRWTLTVKPMPAMAQMGGAVWTGALILTEAQRPLAKAADLQRELGLTAAEAALAIALADGANARQYASRANVSINTVRTHLASLREKLLAKNQAQIVARILRTLS